MNAKSNQKLSDLPSSDDEFWGEGERFRYKPKPIKMTKRRTSAGQNNFV